MGRTVGGVVLLLISALMALGLVWSNVSLVSRDMMVAVLVGVALPAGVGIWLLRKVNEHGRRAGSRAEQRRRATIESEVLRLAALREGRLTVAQVADVLVIPAEEARAVLDGLVSREMADVTSLDPEAPTYRFRAVNGGARAARGLLDD